MYINAQLVQICFSFRKNIINHRDVNLIFFFNSGIICFIINIYSNEKQTALKYLKDVEVNIHNILIMIGDFNIRDNDWDLTYLYHSIYNNVLMEVVNSFDLKLSTPVYQVPT